MKIQVILGSTRPNRITERVAKWVVLEGSTIEGLEMELVDLADFDMPMLDEAISPRYNPARTPNEPAKRFLDKLAEADGYVVATPEYNHSIPGVLKNAFDYLDFQVAKKPFSIVSHGSVGGARAAEHLKHIITEAGAAIVPQAIAMHGASELLDANGKYLGDTTKPYNHVQLLKNSLTELAWWTKTLAAGRKQ
jgi:NAD(P)H-dependent FMN reductase